MAKNKSQRKADRQARREKRRAEGGSLYKRTLKTAAPAATDLTLGPIVGPVVRKGVKLALNRIRAINPQEQQVEQPVNTPVENVDTGAPEQKTTTGGGTVSGGVYGSTKDAVLNAGTSTAPQTSPTISSTGYRDYVDSLGKDIQSAFDETALRKNAEIGKKALEAEKKALNKSFSEDIAAMGRGFDLENKAMEMGQKSDTAAKTTNLGTTGGGYLGFTGSQAGALGKLKAEQKIEMDTLIEKQNEIVRKATRAFKDKEYDLAARLLELSYKTEADIIEKKSQWEKDQLDIATKKREFIEKDLEALALLPEEDYLANVPMEYKAEIDSNYFPGFTDAYVGVQRSTVQAKTQKEKFDAFQKQLNFLQDIPEGQSVSIGGETFTGLGKTSDIQLIKSTDPNGYVRMIEYNKGSGTVKIRNVGRIGSYNTLTAAEADKSKLPASLVGRSEQEVFSSLTDTTPPDWFLEYKYYDPSMVNPMDPSVLSAWDSFRNEVLNDFSGGGDSSEYDNYDAFLAELEDKPE